MQHENIAHKKSGTAGGNDDSVRWNRGENNMLRFLQHVSRKCTPQRKRKSKKAHIAEPARVAFSHFSMFKYFHSLYGVTNLLNN